MEQSTSELAKTIGPRAQFYHARLDSVQSSLRFFSNEQFVGQRLPDHKGLNTALGSYGYLQQRFTQTTYLEQQLLERKQQLMNQLSISDLGKQFTAYRQQVLFYQQQLRQAKELLDQPDKLARELLGYATKLPLFRTFMEKHSAFAAIFPHPDPVGILTNSGSMQTRTALQNQVGTVLGTTDPQSVLQQSMGQAEEQLIALKEKLSSGSFGEAGELPNTNVNEEKTRSLWKRLEWGGNLQSARASNYFPTTSDLGLSLGVKLNSKSVVGIGASYKLGWGSDWRHIRMSYEGVGLRSFLDWRMKGSFWMSGGTELNYRQHIEDLGLLKNIDVWQQSVLLGVARKFKLGKMKTEARLLYDFLWRQQVPRPQPIVFRVGYTIK